MPQIIRYSFVCLPWDSHLVFPYINHPIVQFFISTSHGTWGHPFGTIWDPGGGCWGPLQARQQPKHASNHQIFFCPPSMGLTPNFPTVRSTHSKLLYLDFSWKGDKRISGDLTHVLVVFWLEGAPNAPSPWSPIDNLVFNENLRYKIVLWSMGWFNYGKTGC